MQQYCGDREEIGKKQKETVEKCCSEVEEPGGEVFVRGNAVSPKGREESEASKGREESEAQPEEFEDQPITTSQATMPGIVA